MKNKLLIICRKQFGYHTDTYYYCKYLAETFDITYLCWDYKWPYRKINNVRVKYISREGGILRRYFRFLFQAVLEVNAEYNFCFLKYFPACSALKLAHWKTRYIFDVRTGYVGSSELMRVAHDNFLWLESLMFKNITVISECLARRLRLSAGRSHILPLGSEVISETSKHFVDMRLLYVGTLENRNIEDTVIGFHQFYNRHSSHVKMSYDIIGSGPRREEDKLRKIIQEMGLQELIHVRGYVPHDRIQGYFDRNNIGISFIPMTDFFDCQPPTKTFEYALSGMVVIATATSENKSIINEQSGVLIDDSPGGIYKALEKVYQTRDSYDSEEIRNSCRLFIWDNIVHNNLEAYLKSL